MNRRIVIYDQYAVFHARTPIFTSVDLGADNGSSSTKVAPLPGPSLCAESEPPISLAANAPLCRPNPWPSRLVVNPCEKIFVRFSGEMPMPLSLTDSETIFRSFMWMQ